MERVGHVACIGETRNTYTILDGRQKAKRPFGTPKLISEGNIKVDLKETGSEGVDWLHLVHWRVLV